MLSFIFNTSFRNWPLLAYASFKWYLICSLHDIIDYYKDLIVLTSDSGYLTIIEFNLDSRTFVTLQNYKIGKPGCSKSTPGQYLQISPDSKYIAIGILSFHNSYGR